MLRRFLLLCFALCFALLVHALLHSDRAIQRHIAVAVPSTTSNVLVHFTFLALLTRSLLGFSRVDDRASSSPLLGRQPRRRCIW